jgi:multidrug efflux pump subunit AcrB
MLLLNNDLGKIVGTFSGVVILALLFPLFESKFILPAHLASIDIDDDSASKYRISRYWQLIQSDAQNTLCRFRDGVYATAVEWTIKQRYAVLILFIAIAVVGIGLIANGKVKSVFFPEVFGQIISINVEMNARATYRLNIDNMDKIERIGNEVNAYYVEQGITESPPIQHILKVVSGAYQEEIYAELTPSVEREKADTLSILRE